jgi:hypothetical protein
MLNLLDQLLRDLFVGSVAGITGDDQVGFQPPDDDWRTYVKNLGAKPALNVYLIDLRENRKLRSNDRVRNVQNGVVTETPASVKMDCHYLVSAWSPAQPAPGVEPTLDEHALLFGVVAALTGQESLNPSRVYAPGSPKLLAWPAAYQDHELLLSYLPVEGFRQFAEFWETMGQTHPWKPAVHLTVTVPVPQPTFVAGGIVTTRFLQFGLIGGTVAPEVLEEIGGVVQDPTGAPVAGAWVRLEVPPVAPAVEGQPVGVDTTDRFGRFRFDGLRRNNYLIRARATGLGEAVLNDAVPSPTGSYLVKFP